MHEYIEVGNKLVLMCDHNWSSWVKHPRDINIEVSTCIICNEKRILCPIGYDLKTDIFEGLK